MIPPLIGEDSLHPTYQKNDLVVVSGVVDPQTIQIGDVVVYQSGQDVLTVNRVISKDEYKLILKGDTDFSQSQEILNNQVIGKVVSSRVPLIGSLAKLVKI